MVYAGWGGSWRRRRWRFCCPNRDTAEHYARLYVQLKRAGTPVPDNVFWIAALVQQGVRLITQDAHFDKIPRLLLM